MPAQAITASKPCSQGSTEPLPALQRRAVQGLTMVELLVAASVAVLILSTAFALTMSSRKLYDIDRSRTEVNQNLRAVSEIIGGDVRVAGERLGVKNNFPLPAIEIHDGTELVLRRNLLSQVLTLCEPVLTKSENWIVVAANQGGFPGCAVNGSNVPASVQAWRDYRQNHGPELGGYIFTRGTNKVDFFIYDKDSDAPGDKFRIRAKNNRDNEYTPEEIPILFLVEETKYSLSGDTLELVINKDEAEDKKQKLVTDISNFQVRALMQNGDVLTDYTGAGVDWVNLVAIEVSVTGKVTERGKPLERTFTSRFFPRNVLSN